MCACVCACMRACARACVCACVCACVRACVCVCVMMVRLTFLTIYMCMCVTGSAQCIQYSKTGCHQDTPTTFRLVVFIHFLAFFIMHGGGGSGGGGGGGEGGGGVAVSTNYVV